MSDKVERIKVAEVPVDLVLNNVFFHNKVFFHENKEYLVKMNSQRYFMFRENLSCVCCSLKGTRMFLEYHSSDMTPHFNLYGEQNGELILMTKDHIIAKALGGKDKHSNYQTMCLTCNNLKGHTSLTLDSLKVLRKLYDEKKNILTRKNLHLFLEKAKSKLERARKHKRVKYSNEIVVLKTDLNCYLSKDSIVGKPVYDPPLKNKIKIGCIKQGTVLKPILEYKNKIFCELNNNQSLEIEKKYI
jgi:hypothetical protein